MIVPHAYSCQQCGGAGTWAPDREAVECASCGSLVDLPPPLPPPVCPFDILPLLRDRPDSGRDWTPEPVRATCPACGAPATLEAHVAHRPCENCGSAALTAIDRTGAPLAPGGVLPYRINREQATKAAAGWLSTRGRLAVERVTPEFLPFWCLSSHVHCRWEHCSTTAGVHGGAAATVVEAGVVECDLEDALPATRAYPDEQLLDLASGDWREACPLDGRFLAGSVVRQWQVDIWQAWDRASARWEVRLRSRLREAAGNRLRPPDGFWPEWTAQHGRLLLVPVYVCVAGHGDGALTVLVNGRSGRVAGPAAPPHARRRWPWVLFALALMAALLLLLAR